MYDVKISKNNIDKLNQLIDNTFNKSDIYNNDKITDFFNTSLNRLKRFTQQGGWTGNDYWKDPEINYRGFTLKRGRSSIRYHNGILANYWNNNISISENDIKWSVTNVSDHAKYIFNKVKSHNVNPNRKRLIWQRFNRKLNVVKDVDIINPGQEESSNHNYSNIPEYSGVKMTKYRKLILDNLLSSYNRNNYNLQMMSILNERVVNHFKNNSIE